LTIHTTCIWVLICLKIFINSPKRFWTWEVYVLERLLHNEHGVSAFFVAHCSFVGWICICVWISLESEWMVLCFKAGKKHATLSPTWSSGLAFLGEHAHLLQSFQVWSWFFHLWSCFQVSFSSLTSMLSTLYIHHKKMIDHKLCV